MQGILVNLKTLKMMRKKREKETDTLKTQFPTFLWETPKVAVNTSTSLETRTGIGT